MVGEVIGNLLSFTKVSAGSTAKPKTWKQNQNREHQRHRAPTTPQQLPWGHSMVTELENVGYPMVWNNQSDIQEI